MKLSRIETLNILIIGLMAIISVIGLMAYDLTKDYTVVNQYGETIRMWGSGIYAHDSYFKAPIFIGTDFTILFLMIPMTIIALVREVRTRTIKSKLLLMSLNGFSLYYSASIAFGVTYNRLLLLYIGLFSVALFAMILQMIDMNQTELEGQFKWVLPTKGLSIYLIISGLSLFVAWLPDIIPSLISGESLSMIEVYSTEVTYILDMGIVSPVIFICWYQLKHKIVLGKILLPIILKTCEIIGIMVIVQTVFQALAGIEIPIPVMVTKVGIFVVLAGISLMYEVKIYKHMKDKSRSLLP